MDGLERGKLIGSLCGIVKEKIHNWALSLAKALS